VTEPKQTSGDRVPSVAWHFVYGLPALIGCAWIWKGLSDLADPTFPIWKNDLFQGSFMLLLAVAAWVAWRRTATTPK
jgi:hypothetical protein